MATRSGSRLSAAEARQQLVKHAVRASFFAAQAAIFFFGKELPHALTTLRDILVPKVKILSIRN